MTPVRFLACAALVLLAACAGNTPRQFTNPAPCPSASVLWDASRYVQIHGEEQLANVGFTGEILGVRSFCRYQRDGGPINSDLEIDFGFGRGDAAQGSSHVYSYFVAVTRRDSVVIHKETFSVEADFRRDDIVYEQERIRRVSIPRRDEDVSGENFEIVVGFELTPEQLEFNRSGVRFRTGG